MISIVNCILLDLEKTPVQLYRFIQEKYHNTFILESMEGPQKFATQSIIGFDPVSLVEIREEALFVDGTQLAKGFENILCELQRLLKHYKEEQAGKVFQGGLVGFTSFDIIRYYEDFRDNPPENEFPDAYYGLYLDGIVYDHISNVVHYFHHSSHPSRLSEIRELMQTKSPDHSQFQTGNAEYLSNEDTFKEGVVYIQDKIRGGETFQTVLSQRIQFEGKGNPFYLYVKLREKNPSPYMFFLDFEEYSIIGSSPELLISLRNNELTTYPIAGTRGLSDDETVNREREYELLMDEKEKAEHNMLVDLARNDLGKIAKIGSVQVTEYMTVERFSHVMHIVSKVEAQLKDDKNMFDAFFAVFPAGTVSGAPKIRSMEFIFQLEPVARGPYAGSVGYFGIDHQCVHAITIRTAFGKGKKYAIQAGAGIVLDSDPESEYRETLQKLEIFLEIIG